MLQRELHKDFSAPLCACLRNKMKSYLLKQHTKAHLIKDLILKLGWIPMNMKRVGRVKMVNLITKSVTKYFCLNDKARGDSGVS